MIFVTILSQEFENERIILSTGIKKNYQKKAAKLPIFSKSFSIHYDAQKIL